MAERLNAAVLKTVEGASPPGVRIPLSPFFVSILERCESGRIGLPAKEVYPSRVPRVRIPSSPFFVESSWKVV